MNFRFALSPPLRVLMIAFVLVALALLAGAPSVSGTPGADHRVTICHATSSETNPYVIETVDIASSGFLKAGHADHAGPIWYQGAKQDGIDWGDIIPPYVYEDTDPDFVYPGLNWTTLGQLAWENECVVPAATIAPTTEPTSSISPTTEPTAPPTVEPTAPPTVEPTAPPTVEPTAPPTVEPTAPPTVEPTLPPTAPPTVAPTSSVEPTTGTPTPSPTQGVEEATASPKPSPPPTDTEMTSSRPGNNALMFIIIGLGALVGSGLLLGRRHRTS